MSCNVTFAVSAFSTCYFTYIYVISFLFLISKYLIKKTTKTTTPEVGHVRKGHHKSMKSIVEWPLNIEIKTHIFCSN